MLCVKHYCINSRRPLLVCGFSTFFFPLPFSSPSPCLFSFSLTVSTCVCTVCVKELVSSISRVPPSSTHRERDRRFTLLASSIISPRTYLRDESCQSSKKSLSLALFYCADSGRRRTLRQERNRLSLRFLCVFSFFFFFYLFDDPFRTTRRHTKEINKNT